MKKKTQLIYIALIFSTKLIAQPFVDILSFNYQSFSTSYKDTTRWKNHTDNYALNLFIPKEFKNGNTLLIRINSEMINSAFIGDSTVTKQLSAVSMPLGFMFVSKNKKWKTVAMVIPKLAGDFKDKNLMTYGQLGGIFIENYQIKENVKIKAGLYYNYEAFGNFFMPLVGVDWRINNRLNLYGILPTNYKFEVNIIKNRLYTGLCFKSFTRSFRIINPTVAPDGSTNNPANYPYTYVRYDEEQIKLFLDCFVYKKLLLFAEAGYTLGKSPIEYVNGTEWEQKLVSPVYAPTKPYPILNIGIAYRIRQDLEKKEEVVH